MEEIERECAYADLETAYRNEAKAARELQPMHSIALNWSKEIPALDDTYSETEMTYLHARAITEDVERSLGVS